LIPPPSIVFTPISHALQPTGLRICDVHRAAGSGVRRNGANPRPYSLETTGGKRQHQQRTNLSRFAPLLSQCDGFCGFNVVLFPRNSRKLTPRIITCL